MKVSVALCTFNGAKYILKQLESIASQTLQPDEIIVCDDNSTDTTVAIIREFALNSSIPIQIYLNEKRLGVTKNFKKALDLCQGEYIALCDQDDVWLPANVEKKVAFLEEEKHARINVVFSDLQLVDEHLNFLPGTMWQSLEFTSGQQRQFKKGKALELLLKRGNVVTGASMILRSSFKPRFVKYLEIDSPEYIHDGIIALIAAKENSIFLIPGCPVLYRQHAQQQIGAAKPVERIPLKKRLSDLMKGRIELYDQLGIYITTNKKRLEDFQMFDIDAENMPFFRNLMRHLRLRKRILEYSRVKRFFVIAKEMIMLRYKYYSNSLILDPVRDFFHKRITSGAGVKAGV